MTVLFILLILIEVLCIVFAFKCLKITKNKDINYVSKFLGKFMKILLTIIIISYIISLIIYINFFFELPNLIIAVCASFIIQGFFIIMITKYGLAFIKNLENDIIYNKDNVTYLTEISRTFIYYSIVEVITGFLVTFIVNIIQYPDFNISTSISTSFFMNLLLGIVFYVISLLFERSIEIYEENKLTI